jgi:acetyltransferase-like isoleucine patch superfamily enzyme
MSGKFMVLKWLISFHKYPRYVMDFYIHFILQPVWRWQGVKLGKHVAWRGKPILTTVKGSALSIGDESAFYSRSTQTALGVNHPVVIRTLTPKARIAIGSKVRMSGTTICAATNISIGDRCVIGSNVTIIDTDFHALDPAVRASKNDAHEAKSRPVEIGNDVFIGGGSFILKGAKVGDAAVIGAGSVVTGSVPPRAIFAGNPARQLAAIDPKKLL